jgi:hypothetical protein
MFKFESSSANSISPTCIVALIWRSASDKPGNMQTTSQLQQCTVQQSDFFCSLFVFLSCFEATAAAMRSLMSDVVYKHVE